MRGGIRSSWQLMAPPPSHRELGPRPAGLYSPLPLSAAGGLSTRRSVVWLAMVACTGERAQLLGLLCAEVADGIAVVKKRRRNQDQV
jgi:hypothetical protein